MFEVRYMKDGVQKTHIDVDFDTLFELFKANLNKEIEILSVEGPNHYSYDFESLISNLKL